MDFLKYVMDATITADIETTPKYIVRGDFTTMKEWSTSDVTKLLEQLPHESLSIFTLIEDKAITHIYAKEVPEGLSLRIYQFIGPEFYTSTVILMLDGRYKSREILHCLNGKVTEIEHDNPKYNSMREELLGMGIVTTCHFLNKLADKKTRMANYRMEYRNRDKAKRTYVTRNVTYISNVEYLNGKSCSGFHKTLKWSHSWVVRGSWVKIKPTSIGKDRNGIRNQTGRTWRVEHVKNPDLPRVDKLRIVT